MKFTTLHILIILSLLFCLTGCTRTDNNVVGVWQSENVGLDFPIWMVDTLYTDGTVRVEFYSKPNDKVIEHPDQTHFEKWRIEYGQLEFGNIQENGEFVRSGMRCDIEVDKDGALRQIKGWKRIK